MMKMKAILLLLAFPAIATAGGAETLLEQYAQHSDKPFSAKRGGELWHSEHRYETGEARRSCVRCHGGDLTQPGKHLRTGKAIPPMSRSARADAFTDIRHMKKWFLRNCKWTWGRECTAQEKGDLLTYLLQGEMK